MKIAVAGMGYVGLSNAVLLAAQHDVTVLDIVPEKVALLNARRSPIRDVHIEEALASQSLRLRATLDAHEALSGAEYIIVSTPTNFDDATGQFDTQSVEAVIAQALEIATNATVVVRSTVAIGFTQRMRERFGTDRILFMPEFLREGSALQDNLYPSRIVVGDTSQRGKALGDVFAAAALATNVPILLTGSTEAEAIKLFANSYLAMRVAFFNELDTYAATHHLNAQHIIEGVGMDARIGTHYNNPSFGYGGYCLPKDTRQLLSHFGHVPQQIIGAIVTANTTRMDFIAQDILKRKPDVVGIYRLTMKSGSDNFREASMLGVMSRLREAGVRVVIYEPLIPQDEYAHVQVVHDLVQFKAVVDVIVANRVTSELADCKAKLYSRDIYARD